MSSTLLIDAIVRQTTILLAQLATAPGGRATLAHTGMQVFSSLVQQLREQGLSNKSIADMFGLTLRTYHNRVSRLSESNTEKGRSLWDALLAFIEQDGSLTRRQIIDRFGKDDERMVRGVLRDLVESGVVFAAGRGDSAFYRAAAPDELPSEHHAAPERLACLAWVAVKRFEPVTREQLTERIPASAEELDAALALLLGDGRIQKSETGTYSAHQCVIPVGAETGWEAAVFDHYQAVVTTVCTKIRQGVRRAVPGEWIGGSTYSFEVTEDQPSFQEVVGFLEATRRRAVELRRRVVEENRLRGGTPEGALRVIAYVGQTVLGVDEEENDA